MRLLHLTLSNFRPYRHVDLDLNADGLIGIRGLNGAGKSSLLAAVEWGLFGQKRGAGSTPARRSGASTGERCEVELEFALDGHHYRVVRGERTAGLWVDGQRVSHTLTETANAVSAALGLTRDSFTSTFYARQREIQALNPQGDAQRRREQLEDLLGLTRIRAACNLARADVREQELVLRTLEAEATDPNEAKRLLAELEEQVKQHTPAVEAGRLRLEEATQRRATAWDALTQARERAEQAFTAESQATVAASEAKAGAERRDATAAALAQARNAAQELEELEPAIARAAELRARDGEHELRRQTHERATKLRERRHSSEARRVTLSDQLATLGADTEQSTPIAAQISEVEQAVQTMTTRLLALADELPLAVARASTARAQQAAADELSALSTQLDELAQRRDEQEHLVPQLARQQAEADEIQRTLAEELAHREEIERDGPAALCLRCKRPYGSDFQAIILEYERSIATLSERATRLDASIAAGRTRQQALTTAITALAPVEARKAALQAQLGDEPLTDAEALERQAEKLADEQAQLRAGHDQQEALLNELRLKRETLAASEQERRQLEQAIREAQAEAELFARELDELATNGYDPEAHDAIRQELAAALTAEERAHSLRPHATQLALLEHRLANETELAETTAARAAALGEAATACASDRDALAAAQQLLERADETLARRRDELQQAEELALRDSAEVQSAREAFERARKQGQRLKKERLELRYRSATAAILKDYNAEAQRRAFPAVARETSELLASLTQGQYSDACLDESGALELFDDGAYHPLRRFSGGEQDLANLCLRIALSRALARQRGVEAGFIILDEVFASQDLERRRTLIEQLKELRHDFRQVFVVSHFDNVVDECDVQIDVVRKDGISSAEPLPR